MNEEIIKLTDVINERVAELIQVGFNAAARTKIGANTNVVAPMTIVEKRNGSYHRIPEGTLPEWSGYCTYIREYTGADGSRPGNELCLECDAKKAEEFFSSRKSKWEWYICHAGLVDIAIPIIVGGKVAAVFFGGQKRLKKNQTYKDQLSQKILDLTAKVPGLKKTKLTMLARKIPALSESEIEDFAAKLSEIVSHIGDLARRNYEARKTVALMGRFSEEYMLRRRPLAEILKEILTEVSEFLLVENVILVRSTIQDSIVSSRPLSLAFTSDADVANELLTKLESKLPNPSCTTIFLKRADELSFMDYLENILGISGLEKAFIKMLSFAGDMMGVLIYANPHMDDWELASAEIMTQRLEFLHDLSERLRVQIDIYELDKEKDDLMAEVTHRLKSPMQWLMSETTTLIPRLDFLKRWRDFDPEIVKSIDKIEDIIHFLDVQIRNYTIVATMEKEKIAYDMKLHPLGRLLDNCIQRYSHLATERGLEIKEFIDRKCYKRTLFDWEQMEVAVNNLTDNAIKYSHAKQTVYVTARFDKVRNRFTLRFNSFGVGIAPEEYETIFKKFRRGRIMKDPRRFIPGTGIGLTVARRIARDHGGDVCLVECKQGASDPHRGYKEEGWKVVFELGLPLCEKTERTINE